MPDELTTAQSRVLGLVLGAAWSRAKKEWDEDFIERQKRKEAKRIANGEPKGETITLYFKESDFVLCRGPGLNRAIRCG